MRKKNSRWDNYQPGRSRSNVTPLEPETVTLKMPFRLQGERPQTLDLSFMANRPRVAAVLARVVWAEAPAYAPKSRKALVRSIKIFHDFTESTYPDVADLSALTREMFREYAVWLTDVRGLTTRAASGVYYLLKGLLKSAKSSYPDAFDPDFEAPKVRFRYDHRRATRALSEETIQNILLAAEADVDICMGAYREGDTPENFGQLIPFMLIIGIRTAINPESLYQIRRDCLQPHPIDPAAYYVVWTKRRSKSGVQRQLHYVKPGRRGVIELLKFLSVFTEPLTTQAREPDREMLLLYRYPQGAGRVAAARCPSTVNRALRAFIKRHKLPPFKIVQLRASVATLLYKKTGGNIRKVRDFLGHAYLETTQLYVAEHLVREIHNRSIRAAQALLIERVTVVIPKKAKKALAELESELSPEQRERIADGTYQTGICRCRNPYDSPLPDQQKGRCCTLFLACLSCPNALFFLEDLPRVIGLRNFLLAEKHTMKKDVWESLYKDRLRIIEEDIIAAFSDAQVAEAERAADVTNARILIASGVLQ